MTKAAKGSQLNVVRALLRTRMINIQSQASLRALFWAIKNGNIYIVYVLIKAGVPINGQDTITGYTPLMIAVYKNNRSIIRLLLNHEDIQTTIMNNDGLTAVSLAEKLGHQELIKLLS